MSIIKKHKIKIIWITAKAARENMDFSFEQLKKEVVEKINLAQTAEDLDILEEQIFGRQGKFTKMYKKIKEMADEQRPAIGKLASEIKREIEKLFGEMKEEMGMKKQKDEEIRVSQERKSKIFDLTLPGLKPEMGSLHPMTQVKNELNDAFKSLGFEIYEGEEITSEAYAFDYLNFPPDHPARESMDTYWLAGTENKRGEERLCLRPHLTGASVRYMQTHQPPFRFVYPGRAFRAEATDAGHERCFYQYEALMVNKDISFAGGKILVRTILERIFGSEVKIRMRAGFFPFVEPGFEIDMECQVCGGQGCSVCKHSGWIELMPGGAPHPNVLKAGGIDPKKWQGFYLNVGLDRLVMMKYGIDDIRLFHSGDLRFLKQF